MKQTITVKQLNELSKKGRENFRKHFWKVFDGDLLVYGDYKNGKIDKKIVVFSYGMIPADEESFGYKLLSIGQMVEFLDEQREDIHDKLEIFHGLTDLKDTGGKAYGWNVKIGKFNQGHGKLVDALWEAVKEILEK